MDPNEALKLMRELAKKILAIANEPNCDEPSYDDLVSSAQEFSTAIEMAEQFEALDEWIKSGGFLPEDWKQP
jgi:hypothetical protein